MLRTLLILVMLTMGAVKAHADTTVLIPGRNGGGAQQLAPRQQVPTQQAPATTTVPYPQQQAAPAAPQQNMGEGQDESSKWFRCTSSSECGALPGPCNMPMGINVKYMEQYKNALAKEDMSGMSCPTLGPAELQMINSFVPQCFQGYCGVGPRN